MSQAYIKYAFGSNESPNHDAWVQIRNREIDYAQAHQETSFSLLLRQQFADILHRFHGQTPVEAPKLTQVARLHTSRPMTWERVVDEIPGIND